MARQDECTLPRRFSKLVAAVGAKHATENLSSMLGANSFSFLVGKLDSFANAEKEVTLA